MKTMLPDHQSDKPITKEIKPINKSRTPLTHEILKTFPGCEHYSLEEANIIVESIHKLAVVCLEHNKIIKNNCIDNQQVVYLNKNETTEKVIPLKKKDNPENLAA